MATLGATPSNTQIPRVLGSGSTSVAALTTVTLGTFTRGANERLTIIGYVTESVASLQFNEAGSILGADGVLYFLERTANANEVLAKARNINAADARTLEWIVVAWAP